MNSSWKQFLSQSGAAFDSGAVVHFQDPAAEARAASGGGVICDLSHRGLIAVSGEDAFTFLQGQLSCDLNEVSPSRSRLAAWCSSKGRVLTLFRVIHADDGVLLELPASQIETALKRLKMYVLRARVSLDDVSDEFIRLGLAGKNAGDALEEKFAPLPQAADDAVVADDSRLIRLHGDPPRFQFIGDPERARALWRSAAETLTPAGIEVWALLEILAGVPELTDADQHLPQMLNLDLLAGVSFKKGCYVGQEIVARTHHLGRLKRRMYLIAAAGERPAAGAALVNAEDGSEAGRIVSSAPRADGDGFAALAVLRIDAAESSELCLSAADGPKVELLPMPYPFDGENG